jgi:hypothetical protein
VVSDDGSKIEDYGLNAVCTHLGCVVPWNAVSGAVSSSPLEKCCTFRSFVVYCNTCITLKLCACAFNFGCIQVVDGDRALSHNLVLLHL